MTKLWLPRDQQVVSIDIESPDGFWCIADPHFDHTNIIKYCNRKFRDTEEMNEVMLANWNGTVAEDDIVLFLGDLAFGRDSRKPRWWLTQLNGEKVYLKGSHDKGIRPTSVLDGVLVVTDIVLLRCEGVEVLLIHDYDLKPAQWDGWVIHGHNHNNRPFLAGKRINVSAEVIDYTPIALSKLLDICRE